MMKNQEIKKLEEVICVAAEDKNLTEERARDLHDAYWQIALLKANIITDEEYLELRKEILEKLINLDVL